MVCGFHGATAGGQLILTNSMRFLGFFFWVETVIQQTAQRHQRGCFNVIEVKRDGGCVV